MLKRATRRVKSKSGSISGALAKPEFRCNLCSCIAYVSPQKDEMSQGGASVRPSWRVKPSVAMATISRVEGSLCVIYISMDGMSPAPAAEREGGWMMVLVVVVPPQLLLLLACPSRSTPAVLQQQPYIYGRAIHRGASSFFFFPFTSLSLLL